MRYLKFIFFWLMSIFMVLGLFPLSNSYASFKKRQHEFKIFLKKIEREASKQGVSKKTIRKYLSHITTPKTKVIHKVKKQHHARVNYHHYLHRFTKKKDLNFGINQFRKHHKLLKKISSQFEVPPEFIVALWGIESNYGRYTGKSKLIHVLSSLSFQHIRSKFYRRQLIYALMMLDQPKIIPQQLISSWDGGMGQAQFTPESYASEYAYDYDHDGFVDIWTSLPDVFASMENYLHKKGWQKKEPCSIKITLPKKFPLNLTGKENIKPLKEWVKQGIKLPNKIKYNKYKSEEAAIIAPDGAHKPAYLVLHNFFVLLQWNNSSNEGLATCYLANLFLEKLKKANTKHQPLLAKSQSATLR